MHQSTFFAGVGQGPRMLTFDYFKHSTLEEPLPVNQNGGRGGVAGRGG